MLKSNCTSFMSTWAALRRAAHIRPQKARQKRKLATPSLLRAAKNLHVVQFCDAGQRAARRTGRSARGVHVVGKLGPSAAALQHDVTLVETARLMASTGCCTQTRRGGVVACVRPVAHGCGFRTPELAFERDASANPHSSAAARHRASQRIESRIKCAQCAQSSCRKQIDWAAHAQGLARYMRMRQLSRGTCPACCRSPPLAQQRATRAFSGRCGSVRWHCCRFE